jgi:hypothetical protein
LSRPNLDTSSQGHDIKSNEELKSISITQNLTIYNKKLIIKALLKSQVLMFDTKDLTFEGPLMEKVYYHST